MSPLRESPADLFRAIAEYTYDWETWVDTQGSARWVNAAVTRITGYTVEECLAMPHFPLPLAHPEDREILQRVLDDARAGGAGNDRQFRVCTKEGSERWVAISWQAVRSDQGAALGYRTSIRDIDERKRMEDELRRLRQRAEALAQARSELLANVSHELRTPAHVIGGYAELLLRERIDPKQQRYAAIILDQCRSMQRQVEDLLSLTALEAGGVELLREPVDLRSLTQGVIEAGQPRALERGLSLRAELALTEPVVLADALRLTQILRNLIDNALKFTERGSITLRASQSSEEPRQLCFEVIDTGPGMDPDQIKTLLLPFRQGDGGKRREAGVGLGLAIVQRMVNAMQGELQIDSQPGQGTHVYVRLPWQRAQVQAIRVQSDRVLVPGLALVVDDSGPARELLCELLRSCSFAPREAADADAACALAAAQPFDVVFLDYQMPGCDGGETALRLRGQLRSASGERVPIYLLTANVAVHQQLGAAQAAIDGVLAKPLSRSSLVRVLDGLRAPSVPPPPLQEPDSSPLAELVVQDLLTTRAHDHRSLLHRLLPRVDQAVAKLQEQARAQLAQRDAQGLRRHAHSLAGESGLVGALAATRAAQALERLLEDRPDGWDAAEQLLARHTAAWSEARALLSQRLAELDKS
ncbi:MAG TPA: ATP-binding protein [Polyangiales bacterium]